VHVAGVSLVQVVRRLLDKPSARVVIVFLRVEDARELLTATRRLNETGRFVWIASDGWGKEELPVLGGNNVAAEGALTIELQTTPLPEFDVYFRQLRPATNERNPWSLQVNERNPWFNEYWERAHGCTFDDDSDNDRADNGGQRRNSSSVLTYKVCRLSLCLSLSVSLAQCSLSPNGYRPDLAASSARCIC